MNQLEKAEKDLKNELMSEYQVFLEMPEIHPQFQEVRDMFMEEYQRKFGDVEDLELRDTIWTKFWEEVLQEKQESEWREKLEILRKQCKALESTADPSKESDIVTEQTGQLESFSSHEKLCNMKSQRSEQSVMLPPSREKENISGMDENLVKCSLLQAFAILEELSEFLGIFGPAMKMLMQEVVKLGVSSKEALEVLSNEDNNILIKTVAHKLLSLSKAVESPLSDRLLEGSTETLKLLKFSVLQLEVKKSYNGVDIEAVAKSSHKKDVSSTIEMIKNSLRESGVDNYSAEDINQIYLAVSQQHLDMAL